MIEFDLQNALDNIKSLDLSDKTQELSTIFATANDMVYNQVVANANTSITQRGSNKYGLTISDGIGKSIYKNGTGASTYVSRKGNYIMYFLAKGTKDRFTKKKYYRGKIEPNPFFKNAVDAQISNVVNYIENEITNIITTNE